MPLRSPWGIAKKPPAGRSIAITRAKEWLSHNHSITLHDGRRFGYTDLGDPNGTPVMMAHGMPGSRLEGWFFHDQAVRHGFRIITPDRPGIGNSDFQPNRKLLDYPGDIEQLADALSIDRFIPMGWSSGGSRSLACAYSLKSRVSLAVVLSGYTNFSEYPGRQLLLQPTRWPGPQLARLSPRLLRVVVQVVVWLSRHHPGLYLRQARHMVNEEDRNILGTQLDPPLFSADQMTCLESGAKAISQDLLTELEPWGFSLEDIQVPTLLYQGEEDPFVPRDYAQHLADRLPQADLTWLPGSGHLYPLSDTFQQYLFSHLREHNRINPSFSGGPLLPP